ncbi:Spore coat assembly protein-like protein [Methanocorpusculum labreanum Z]|uniref:Spore coat assembly protein-like protein n=1 Tax=Methanocorpusculum labreanum (strain ATCC 43576 / DSM 4855 / Z) TaxID=410358 RepID=A2STV4_METLZ|nr:CotH kinase family protein [Methanocorpusculum labreanum]ABN07760.1 Spore coat assembly protein-like protein [Methanocorpusculum labreanum Z]
MKYINTITIFLIVGAVLFTCMLMFNPTALGITAKDTLYESTLFDKDGITTVNITISDENWADMLENPLEEEFHLCDITVNGETYDSVAIRTKGLTSLSSVASSDSDRYSFKLKADKYVSGQSFDGLDEFVLNNIYQDATYMKEYLSYEMMDYIGVDTPLYSYAAVYINGEYFGLYLMVEAPEEDFLDRVYGADYGELYKPDSISGEMGNMGGGEGDERTGFQMPDAGNLTGFPDDMNQMDFQNRTGIMNFTKTDDQNMTMPTMGGGGMEGGMSGSGGGADLVYIDDDIDSYDQIFDNAVTDAKKSDEKRVITAIRNLNEGTYLETYVDVDEVLRYFAANTALVNLDSYVSSMKHNYYLYEEDGQISILPWDFNLAFAAYGISDASEAVNFPIDTPVASGVSLDERPLIGVLLENEEYKELYHAYLEKIATEFYGDSFDERIAAIDALIGDYVESDPTAFYTYDEYKTGITTLVEYGDLRAESILGQLNDTIPSTEEEQTANPDLLVDASDLNLSAMGSMSGGGGAFPMGTPSVEQGRV